MTIAGTFAIAVQYYQAGRLQEAEAVGQKILQAHPDHIEAIHLLGVIAHQGGRHDEAVRLISRAIKLDATVPEFHNNIGEAYRAMGELDKAVACYQRALALKPAYPEVYRNLGDTLQDQGKTGEAAAAYRRAQTLQPSDGIKIKLAILLPVIMGTREEVMASRTQFVENLEVLSKETLALADPVREVGQTNFYLTYHGRNNCDLLVKMAEIYERACPSLLYTAPHCLAPRRVKRIDKIKIGFLSRFFKNHSIAKAARGLLALLSREKFDVTAIFVPPVSQDETAAFIQQHADRMVVLPGCLMTARERLAEEAFDILFYQDTGVDPFAYFLAFARLAPVQCVFFGHAETSGVHNIDYFISSENLEPEDFQDHYSERLIKLKSSCAYYYKPVVPDPLKPRSAFGLDDADHVYLCPQTLLKFHPEFDEILAAILEADSQARLVLKGGEEPHWTTLLMKRFERTLGHLMSRISVLPPQPGSDFINLIAVSDVMLDTLHFSGFTTSMEAFAVGTPVVTLPGEYQRGRLTLSLYKAMGMRDCVAESPAGYIKLAVRLGTDANYREQIKAKILARNRILFEDMDVVREYERVFLEMFQGAQSSLNARRTSW